MDSRLSFDIQQSKKRLKLFVDLLFDKNNKDFLEAATTAFKIGRSIELLWLPAFVELKTALKDRSPYNAIISNLLILFSSPFFPVPFEEAF